MFSLGKKEIPRFIAGSQKVQASNKLGVQYQNSNTGSYGKLAMVFSGSFDFAKNSCMFLKMQFLKVLIQVCGKRMALYNFCRRIVCTFHNIFQRNLLSKISFCKF